MLKILCCVQKVKSNVHDDDDRLEHLVSNTEYRKLTGYNSLKKHSSNLSTPSCEQRHRRRLSETLTWWVKSYHIIFIKHPNLIIINEYFGKIFFKSISSLSFVICTNFIQGFNVDHIFALKV